MTLRRPRRLPAKVFWQKSLTICVSRGNNKRSPRPPRPGGLLLCGMTNIEGKPEEKGNDNRRRPA